VKKRVNQKEGTMSNLITVESEVKVMEATPKNEKTARTIINVLAENGHTVIESSDILRYVKAAILDNAKVQKVNTELFEAKES
jgi:DNA-directed RNA polymerase specialized sigma54-like protein